MTPGWDAEQGSWRYSPEDASSRNGGRRSRGEPRPRVVINKTAGPQDESVGTTLGEGLRRGLRRGPGDEDGGEGLS